MNAIRGLLKGDNQGKGQPNARPSAPDDEGEGLHCFNCLRRITSSNERTTVDGSFEHTFTNPHNLEFHIGCFRNAPGCQPVGDAVDEFTWFPGYAWIFAVCSGCGEHLGWKYAGQDQFYGLILKKLVPKR